MKKFINSIYKRKDEYCFIITISKEQAKYLLSLNDPENREIIPKRVDDYKNIMNAGNWEVKKGSFLGFSYFGKSIGDGQHRLTAFINSNLKELETFICFG